MRNTLFAAASAFALMTAAALAQTPAPGAQPQTGTPSGGTSSASTTEVVTEPNLTRASTLIDQDVYNPNGDNIGDLEDFVIDPKSGQIQQAVIGVGGFLGIGQKLVAVPYSELKVEEVATRSTAPSSTGNPGATGSPPAGTQSSATTSSARTRVVVNKTREQLNEAPEFKFEEARR